MCLVNFWAGLFFYGTHRISVYIKGEKQALMSTVNVKPELFDQTEKQSRLINVLCAGAQNESGQMQCQVVDQ